MKTRRFLSAVLAAVMILGLLSACSGNAEKPTGSLAPESTAPSPEHQNALIPYDTVGTDINLEQKYKFDTVYIREGVEDMLFFDVNMPDPKSPDVDTYSYYPNAIYQYDLDDVLRDIDGTVMISLDEVQKIFGPGTKYEENDGSYTFYYKYNAYVFHSIDNNPVWTEEITDTNEVTISGIKEGAASVTVDGSTVELSAAFAAVDGKLYVPFVEFAEKAMGLHKLEEDGYVALYKSAEPVGETFAPERLAQIERCAEDTEYKMTGNRWFLIYLEDINKLHPYQLYIPSSYDGTAAKLSLMLHGGTGNENAALVRGFEGAGLKVEPYADEYNYMLLLPNAIGSTWWGCNDELMRKNGVVTDPVELAELEAAEKAVYLCMRDAMSRYNIDAEKLFITGNSMGSTGTIYLAQEPKKFAEFEDIQFKAAAPTSGHAVSDRVLVPTLYVWGDQDDLATKLEQYGIRSEDYAERSTAIVIEYGHHSWSYESHMEAIFTFFDSVLDGTWLQDGAVTEAAFTAGSNIAKTNSGDVEMAHAAIDTGDGVVKVAVSDLEQLFDNFQSYRVLMNDVIGLNWYGPQRNPDINGGKGVSIETHAMTLRYGNQTVNIKVAAEDPDEAVYNAEHKLDTRGTITGVEVTAEGDGITAVRREHYGSGDGTGFIRYADFTTGELSSPVTVIDDEVYVPVYEIMDALGMKIAE